MSKILFFFLLYLKNAFLIVPLGLAFFLETHSYENLSSSMQVMIVTILAGLCYAIARIELLLACWIRTKHKLYSRK